VPEEDVSLLHPLYSTKTTSTEDPRQQLSLSLAICGNPFPKMIRGRRTSALEKEGRPPLRRDPIFIFRLLARLSWFFYFRPVRAL
jgi:hypothetical protein